MEEIRFDEVRQTDGTKRRAGLDRRSPSRWVAWLMDEVIEIPGTNLKIGLDPLLGLLPGAGDFAGAIISCVGLVEAMRRGLPARKLWQVVGNILTNAGIGTLPVVGDLFSVVFRSNSRNRDIINEWLKEADERQIQGSWWRIILVVGVIFGIIIAAIVLNLLLWALIFGSIGQWINSLTG